MEITIVRYKLKSGKGPENEAYISAVFKELKAKMPAGLQYASTKTEDNLSFTHIVAGTKDAPRLDEFSAFREFTRSIEERCEEQPVATRLSVVGSYNLFEMPKNEAE